MKFRLRGSIKQKILALLFLVLSFVVVFLIQPKNLEAKSKTVKVLQVSNDIEENTIIKSSDLKTIIIGSYQLPKDVMRAEEKESVIGLYSNSYIKKGHFLYKDDVMVNQLPKDEFLYEENAKNCIAFNTDLAKAVGGLVQKDDIIKLLIYQKSNNLNEDSKVFDIGTARVVKILNNSGSKISDESNNTGGLGTSQQSKPSVIIVQASTGEQEKLIARYDNEAVIQVVLLPRNKKYEDTNNKHNSNVTTTIGKTQNPIENKIETEKDKPKDNKSESKGGFDVN